MSKHTKNTPRCCVWIDDYTPCEKFQFSCGRCHEHYQRLKKEHPEEAARLRRMNFEQRQAEYRRLRTTPPSPRPWEFEPSAEQTEQLIAQCGGNDSE